MQYDESIICQTLLLTQPMQLHKMLKFGGSFVVLLDPLINSIIIHSSKSLEKTTCYHSNAR